VLEIDIESEMPWREREEASKLDAKFLTAQRKRALVQGRCAPVAISH
jgi:hypothetical protein